MTELKRDAQELAAALHRTLAGFREDLAIAQGASRADLQRAIEDIERQLDMLGVHPEGSDD